MANTMQVTLENYKELMAGFGAMQDKVDKAVDRTLGEFKKRGPAWISKEVAKEYNIKKADINEANKGSRNSSKVKIKGTKIGDISLVYQGRLLTPTHFGMTPKAPVPWYECYRNYDSANTVRFKVKRNGKRKAIGHKVFLAHSGSEGSMYIPFQRRGDARLPIDVIKTLSVPQMITNEKVAQGIHESINENLGKRLTHHLSVALK